MAIVEAEWSKGLVEISAEDGAKFGAGVDIWQLGQLPEFLHPSCWGIIAARLLLSLPFDDAVRGFLEYIGKAARADRVWLLRFNEGMTLLRNTNEWCRPGISSHVADLQNVPVTMLGEMLAPLRDGKSVAINDVSTMSRSLRTMQAEFKHQGLRSTLTVPIISEAGLIGCIGLDATRDQRNWTDDEVHALMQIAALMGVAKTEGAPRSRSADEAFSVPVYLRNGASTRGIPLSTIAAVRADGNGSMVHLSNGGKLVDDRPLRWWQSILPVEDFLRVHRSAIANIRSAEILRPRSGSQDMELVVTGDCVAVPIARTKAPEVRRRLGV